MKIMKYILSSILFSILIISCASTKEGKDTIKTSDKTEFKDIAKNVSDMNDSTISKSSYKDAKIKFKHLVDYYLTSGSDFGKILRSVDSENIFSVLLSG